jgi:hypothetical protein
MLSLQSDFICHSLIFLLGPAELVHLSPSRHSVYLAYLKRHKNQIRLTQSSGPASPDSLEEQFVKAKSSNVAQTILRSSNINHNFGNASINETSVDNIL